MTNYLWLICNQQIYGCRGLNNIVRMHVKRVNCSEWEQISVPSRLISIVTLFYYIGSNMLLLCIISKLNVQNPKYLTLCIFLIYKTDESLFIVIFLSICFSPSFFIILLFETICNKIISCLLLMTDHYIFLLRYSFFHMT